MDGPDLEQVKAFALAVYGQLDRLGLRWRLRPATVTQVEPTGTIRARLDGDTAAVRVVSMVGPVAAGERVMIVTTPPSGSHIVGWVGGRTAGAGAPAALFGMSGTATVTFAAATNFTLGVNFPKPFAAAPRVFTNIASTTPAAGWSSRAVAVTATGFNLHLTGTASAAWSAVPVQWLAVVA
ncbi:hypothetical protein Ait01nite_020440 [Actinoplanes italicus]|uniref:H-type lectin domain-containing protein n=1 Tax=Actinoplanes italicus TaxID=113567 RepID=A0A2T0KP90_9ACTN|nr:H-type lectin domain-containing protein [Actinoplanes italicus]PRX25557.1 H-type lectin domain-containing protein [Actinoplanes italicus]GIE28999.1 hypothetical protein Ait01nite_020440 [Actinoplanes italicus]